MDMLYTHQVHMGYYHNESQVGIQHTLFLLVHRWSSTECTLWLPRWVRMCPQHTDVVATHSDSPLTYVWNMTSQPHRGAMQDQVASVPDLM